MDDPTKNPIIGDIRDEVVSMYHDGLSHPSTKPVLTAAALGGVAGLLLPFVSLPLGAVVGAGYMLYKRVRP